MSKTDVIDFLESIGIGYKYLINGFIGSVIWSIYKKTKFVAALRQIIIGSVVAGYLTPLIAYSENIPNHFMSALSFVVGMIGMVIIDSLYNYVIGKIKALKAGEKIIKSKD